MKIQEQIQQVPLKMGKVTGKEEEKHEKKVKSCFKNISNLSYLKTLYGHLFEDTVHIRFSRDWKLPDKQYVIPTDMEGAGSIEEKKEEGEGTEYPFRTTWSAGYFLDHRFEHMGKFSK